MSNEAKLLIDGTEFKYWDGLKINRPIDSITTFALTAPFDPDVPLLRDTFVPLSYKPVELAIDGELLLSGKLFPSSRTSPAGTSVTCGGYSKPGVLNDCEAPQEFIDVDLKIIAETVAQPFGIVVDFVGAPGTAFDQVAAGPSSKALAFLIKLAKQRGFLIGDTPAGALRIFKPTEATEIAAAIHQNDDKFISCLPTFNDQQYFSAITGLSAGVVGLGSEEFTVANDKLAGVYRPHTYTLGDTVDVDIQEATRAKMGRMFADAIRYELEVQGWRDDLGDVWTSGKRVKVLSPGAMIYNETDFIVKKAKLSRASGKGDTTTLSIVLPGVYSGEIPSRLPWEI
jgi:prophage tail gpP-like protein